MVSLSPTSGSGTQTTLHGTGSSATVSGDTLSLNLPLSFGGKLVGLQNVYLYAAGKTSNSPWVQEGTWITAPLPQPTLQSLSPASGSGITQTFTAVYSDSQGLLDLNHVYLLFNTSLQKSDACFVAYYPDYLNQAPTTPAVVTTPPSA